MKTKDIIRSISSSQDEILASIIELHCPDGFDCDLTYGNGSFWSGTPSMTPAIKFDKEPLSGAAYGDSTAISLPDSSLSSVVFDPPFLTYIRSGRTGNGNMALAKRFAGYWEYQELSDHYKKTISECARVLKKDGVLVFKCQDIIHNHRMHCTHANVIKWAEDNAFRLLDLFILQAKHRMPSPNRAGRQKHARIFHSYFLVFKNLKTKCHLIQPASTASC